MTLVQVRNLKKYFPLKGGRLKAVDGIDIDIEEGEVFALVGESGCGKSTVAKTLLRLLEPTAGSVHFDSEDLLAAPPKRLKALRREMQIIFQDPYASLNPRMTVLDIVAEPLDIHRLTTRRQRTERVLELLELVGLGSESLHRYPHEFSGGQRQRIGIARALASKPRFLVCDEPISALDLSIQAQVVNLLQKLQRQMNLTYLFISHDLAMVRHLSDHVAVMYLGQIVETGPTEELFTNPRHPYTQALLSAVPIPNPAKARAQSRIMLREALPSPLKPPGGCPFHPRCPFATKSCEVERPAWRSEGPRKGVSCHLSDAAALEKESAG